MSLSADDTHSVRRNAVLLVDDEALTIKGPDVFKALRPHGLRPIYLGTVGGWCLDRSRRGVDRLGDVLAVLDRAGFNVRVVEAELWNESPDHDPQSDQVTSEPAASEGLLF